MSFLQNLQDKPRAARVKILWTTAGIASVLLFIGWLVFIPKKYPAEENKVGMFSSLKGEVKDGLVGEEYQNIKKSLGEFEQIKTEVEKKQRENSTPENSGEEDNIRDYRLPLE